MQLENISVTIRPRNPWEAMDLGIVLVRKWWKAVFIPWLLLSAVIFLALNFIFQKQLWIAVLVFWWLKPFYDRFLLSVFSQSLFDDPPSLRETLSKIPGLFKTGLFVNLTLLRFNVYRSFHLPIWQLEGLRGTKRRDRIRVVSGRTGSYALSLTLICLLFELLIWSLMIGLIAMFTPEETDFNIFDFAFSEKPPTWMDVLDNFANYLAILIIEPIYVAAGFMLYINRRTQLEGWDIELAFRRMNNRLQKLIGGTVTTTLLLSIIIMTSLSPAPAYAEEDPPVATTRLSTDKAADTIKKVLQREEFNDVVKRKFWLPKEKDEDEKKEADSSRWQWLEKYFESLGDLLGWIALSFRALLWLLLAVVIGLLFVYRDRWLHLFTLEKKTVDDYVPPEQMFGLEITPESLPEDISSAAREKMLAGDYRGALGLLYRGALSVLIQQDKVEVNESHTEGDVLELARESLQSERQEYLSLLTGLWQQIAYAHRQPDRDHSLHLCDQWQQFEMKTS